MAENLNLSDSAKAVGLSRKTLYTHIKEGKISVTRYEGKRCIAVSELLRVYGNIDISAIQKVNTRLQSEKTASLRKKDTEVILSRLQEIQEDNNILRKEMQLLRETTQQLLTDQEQRRKEAENAVATRKENEALLLELERLKKRGWWRRILGRKSDRTL
jgi:predicted DNA-binding protein YlxM (UPF0122 family)